MKKFLLGILRILFELLQMILRPIGRIGTGVSSLALIIFIIIGVIEGFSSTMKTSILIIFCVFILFSILWRIGTIILPIKAKEEITVKVIDEKTGEEIPCETTQSNDKEK